jgi:hypothetical protein
VLVAGTLNWGSKLAEKALSFDDSFRGFQLDRDFETANRTGLGRRN